LFALPESERPDALVISDDNLVPEASAGLLSLGLRTPAELTVIAHANLPHPPTCHVPCEFLAFDSKDVIQTCIDRIQTMRSGGRPRKVTLIQPIFVPQDVRSTTA
jgi:DNA-binding LacI/PurR family transcriptional regulator